MKLSERYAFRLGVSAIGATGLLLALVGGLLWLSEANGSVVIDEPEPRLSTPAEIAQAALDGQIESMRNAGFDQQCLMDVEISGERCIERCVPRDKGFYLAVVLGLPKADGSRSCSVMGCACEGEEIILEPGIEEQSFNDEACTEGLSV